MTVAHPAHTATKLESLNRGRRPPDAYRQERQTGTGSVDGDPVPLSLE